MLGIYHEESVLFLGLEGEAEIIKQNDRTKVRLRHLWDRSPEWLGVDDVADWLADWFRKGSLAAYSTRDAVLACYMVKIKNSSRYKYCAFWHETHPESEDCIPVVSHLMEDDPRNLDEERLDVLCSEMAAMLTVSKYEYIER